MLTLETSVVRYTITSGVTEYSIPFAYWAKDEIVVIRTEADLSRTTLILDTDYSLSTPDGESGTLTKISDWGSAVKLTILRDVSPTQEKDFINGQTLDAEQIEESFDKLTAIAQEHKEEIQRTLKVPEDEAGINISLPPISRRKGSSSSGAMLGFGADGVTMISRDLKDFDDDVQDAKDAAAAAETAQGKAEDAQEAAETAQGKAEDAQEAAETAQTNAESYAQLSREYSEGKKLNGDDVAEGEPGYENNAKYWAGMAQEVVEDVQDDIEDLQERLDDCDFSETDVSPDNLPSGIKEDSSDGTTITDLDRRLAGNDFSITDDSQNIFEDGADIDTPDGNIFDNMPADESDGLISSTPEADTESVVLSTVASAPASSDSTGKAGQMYLGTDYVYFCIATNTWRRAALAEF